MIGTRNKKRHKINVVYRRHAEYNAVDYFAGLKKKGREKICPIWSEERKKVFSERMENISQNMKINS